MKKFAASLLALTLAAPAVAGDGTVVSILNTSNYVYAEVQKDGRTQWVAAPMVDLKTGNQVRFDDGAVMSNFQSKQLQRQFPAVMFVQQIVVTAEK